MKTKSILIIILLIISVSSFGQFEKYKSFEELDSVSKYYFQKNDIDSAILSIEFALNKYPEQEKKARYILSFFYLRSDDEDKAIANWNSGHDKGYYYGLNQNYIFNNYKDNPEFLETAKQDKIIGHNLDSLSHVEYEVILPMEYDKTKKYPLVYVFHGNSRNLNKAKNTWSSKLLSNEFIVVYLQSYIHSNDYDYRWTLDDEKTFHEVEQICETVMSTHSIDTNKIVLAGMSAGGMLAIDYGFSNKVQCTDLLLNCPVFRALENDMVNNFINQDKSIYIISGEDDFALKNQKMLIKEVQDRDGNADMKIIEGMGHDSEDFTLILDEHLKNIIN